MLTPAQETALANAIFASTDPAVVTAREVRDDVTLLNWANAARAPATAAWRKAADPQLIDDAPNYGQFDAIDPGKRDSWGFLLRYPRDFTRQRTRNWIVDVWGAAIASSNSERILQAGTESITNAQFAIGPGSATITGTVSALNRQFDRLVTLAEVSDALNHTGH